MLRNWLSPLLIVVLMAVSWAGIRAAEDWGRYNNYNDTYDADDYGDEDPDDDYYDDRAEDNGDWDDLENGDPYEENEEDLDEEYPDFNSDDYDWGDLDDAQEEGREGLGSETLEENQEEIEYDSPEGKSRRQRRELDDINASELEKGDGENGRERFRSGGRDLRDDPEYEYDNQKSQNRTYEESEEEYDYNDPVPYN